MAKRYVTINGETRCIADWARYYGIKPSVVHLRLVRGWDIEKALTTPISVVGKTVTINKRSKNIKKWAEEYGISVSTVYGRIKRGWDPKKAITTPAKERNIEVAVNGETKSTAEWSEVYKVPGKLILQRLYNGWDPKDAVSRPISKQSPNKKVGDKIGRITLLRKVKKGKTDRWECACDCGNIFTTYPTYFYRIDVVECMECRGKRIYKSRRPVALGGRTQSPQEWADELGISVTRFLSRLEEWSEDEILGKKERKRGVLIKYKGVEKNMAQWAKDLGISREGIRQRVCSGWTLDEILTTKKHKNYSREGKRVGRKKGSTNKLYKIGSIKNTITGWAKTMGVSRSTIQRRIDGGWSVEDAILTPPTPRSRRNKGTLYVYLGEKYNIRELSEISGVPESFIREKIRRGLSVEEIMEGKKHWRH
jgi:hypothetical protein